MKIVRPYARIWDASSDGLSKIEWCARISHRTEEAQTDESWKRFLKSVVIDHGDWSVVEHVSATVDALVDRGITHEWVRHRLFGFTQESTRFVNYNKTKEGQLVNPPGFVYPKPDVECSLCLSGDESIGGHQTWGHVTGKDRHRVDCPYDWVWLDGIDEAERHYKTLISSGWRPQEARSVLPNALASRIVITGNLRNWRHFLIMRTTAETHPQFRQVTIPLLAEFQKTFPILFDDIIPMQKQSEAIKKAR